jgi:hypothetical protein
VGPTGPPGAGVPTPVVNGQWIKGSGGTAVWAPIADADLPPRLGVNGPIPTDFNNVTQAGWYRAWGSTANTPASDSVDPNRAQGFMQHFDWAPDAVGYSRQVYYPLYSDEVWERRQNGGAWGAWMQIQPAAVPARLGAAGAPAGSDLNAVVSNGWYAVSPNTANAPSTGYWLLHVIAFGPNDVYQYAYSDTAAPTVYVRTYMASAWSAWAQSYPLTDAMLPARIGPINAPAPGNDCNQITQNGWWDLNAGANCPPTGSSNRNYGYLLHLDRGGSPPSVQRQLYFPVWMTEIWQRVNAQGGWTAWKLVAQPDSNYGTAFPADPVDGVEYTLVNNAADPYYVWRFRYNAGSTSAYKWEFVGGSAWSGYCAPGAFSGLSNTGGWLWANINGGSLLLPRPGVYLIRGDMGLWDGTSNQTSLAIGDATTPTIPLPGGRTDATISGYGNMTVACRASFASAVTVAPFVSGPDASASWQTCSWTVTPICVS